MCVLIFIIWFHEQYIIFNILELYRYFLRIFLSFINLKNSRMLKWLLRLRANLKLGNETSIAVPTTCLIYMTKVAISQKKVFDNFYQIRPLRLMSLAQNFIYWNDDLIQWRRNRDRKPRKCSIFHSLSVCTCFGKNLFLGFYFFLNRKYTACIDNLGDPMGLYCRR